jgi:hypothetical protein
MIAPNRGSSTFSAGCEAESHLIVRSCFSGHCLLCRLTSSRNAHVTDDDPSILQAFFIRDEPTERLATAPRTPASSKASRAAEYCGDLPFFGQPFGVTQRWVSCDVMSMNCGRREPGAQPVWQSAVLKTLHDGRFTRIIH